MRHPLLDAARIEDTPGMYLGSIGEIFATFSRSQDSGNVSYGVRIGDERFFVKTAGEPDNPAPLLNHRERIALLHNAVELAQSSAHPALAPLRHVIAESPHGLLLVYDWLDGELLGVPRADRNSPRSAFQRFRALPPQEIVQALDTVFDVHRELARAGWIASDFYDGCLIYDFARKTLRLIDLDTYHGGPFTNTMGRMFGSSRFMAPEEFALGAAIDERTTVFTLGRTIAEFLSDGTLDRAPFRGNDAPFAVMERACREDRAERFASVEELCAAWFSTPDREG